MNRLLRLLVTCVLCICGVRSAAHAEFVFSAYGGKAITTDGDLTLRQPGETRLTLHQVSWTDDSFKDPPYYGLRLAFYPSRGSSWGVAIDFTHAKTILRTTAVVPVTGTRAGIPVHQEEQISSTIDSFELSHGHNLLTFNGMYRWRLADEPHAAWSHRLQLYTGAGIGIAIPHVEARINGIQTFNYQVTGPAVEGLLGLSFDLFWPVSVFSEYKLTYAAVTAELQGGGSIDIQPLTHHFALGIAFGF